MEKKLHVIILWICIILVIGNFFSVFGIDILVLDDQFRYTFGIRNEVLWALGKRSFLWPVPHYLLIKLMTFSPEMGRLAVVLFGCVPLSLLFYVLYTRTFKLRPLPAFMAAVLPNILPGQTLIPQHIDASYIIFGLQLAMASLLCGIGFVQKDSKGWWKGVLAILFFTAAAGIMDHAVFIVFPIVFLLLTLGWFNKKSLWLSAGLAIIAILKLSYIITHPWGVVKSVWLGFHGLFMRLLDYHYAMQPLPLQLVSTDVWLKVFSLGLSLLFIGIGIKIMWKNCSINPVEKSFFWLKPDSGFFPVVFAFIWIGSLLGPFMISFYAPDRYAYPAAFGLILLLYIFGEQIAKALTCIKRKHVTVLLCFICLSAGVGKNVITAKAYAAPNKAQSVLKKNLASYAFPPNAQIAILNLGAIPTGGIYWWSSGALQFILKRTDLSGLISKELSYYDPFDKPSWDINKRNTGLKKDQPLFIFRFSKGDCHQLHYFLRWYTPDDPESPWSLFQLESQTGIATRIEQGKGKGEYVGVLKQRNILQTDVAWGGNE